MEVWCKVWVHRTVGGSTGSSQGEVTGCLGLAIGVAGGWTVAVGLVPPFHFGSVVSPHHPVSPPLPGSPSFM